jgi:hypothetical protein
LPAPPGPNTDDAAFAAIRQTYVRGGRFANDGLMLPEQV